MVRADSLAATYGMQAEFSTAETMAFFPATLALLPVFLTMNRPVIADLRG